MMTMKEKLIREYPLTTNMDCPFECYWIVPRRYVIFFEEKINSDNIESLLDIFNNATKNNFSQVKTLIIVGHTDEQFRKEDLLFFNGVDTFVVYYLKNYNTNEIYFNDQMVLLLSSGWRKIIKKFNKILQQQ